LGKAKVKLIPKVFNTPSPKMNSILAGHTSKKLNHVSKAILQLTRCQSVVHIQEIDYFVLPRLAWEFDCTHVNDQHTSTKLKLMSLVAGRRPKMPAY
jgi:hypothetical protein